ncbi:hypothetical protein [Aliikangiella maris]|uniref:Uncharacterized protein n=2 Tax=Aliikangiella maris TaxID=3162458 RepID=A0ABV2BZK1_9GAMM
MQNKPSPYRGSGFKHNLLVGIDRALSATVNFVVHTLFRIKPKTLKFKIDSSLLELYAEATRTTWHELDESRSKAAKIKRQRLLMGSLISCVLLFAGVFLGIGIVFAFIAFLLTLGWAFVPESEFQNTFNERFVPKLLQHLPGYT